MGYPQPFPFNQHPGDVSSLYSWLLNVSSMKHMERSVNDGLVALATSDLFLCLVYFIASLYWNKLVLEQVRGGGLVALATSDLFLCLVYFIASLYWNKLNYDSLVELYYRTYEESFINFFLLARYDHWSRLETYIKISKIS